MKKKILTIVLTLILGFLLLGWVANSPATMEKLVFSDYVPDWLVKKAITNTVEYLEESYPGMRAASAYARDTAYEYHLGKNHFNKIDAALGYYYLKTQDAEKSKEGLEVYSKYYDIEEVKGVLQFRQNLFDVVKNHLKKEENLRNFYEKHKETAIKALQEKGKVEMTILMLNQTLTGVDPYANEFLNRRAKENPKLPEVYKELCRKFRDELSQK